MILLLQQILNTYIYTFLLKIMTLMDYEYQIHNLILINNNLMYLFNFYLNNLYYLFLSILIFIYYTIILLNSALLA